MIPKSLRRRCGPSLVAAFTLLIVSALVAGCAASAKDRHFAPKRVTRHEEAGSARVAVLSVGHFDREAITALQPDFTMPASQALKEVLPTTFLMEQKLLDVLKVALGANLAPTAAAASAPEVPVVDVQGDRTAADLPGREEILDKEIGVDPFLRYTLATAFFQEVQLLNRYVIDAAQRRDCTPYIVRAQVSLMPMARNQPYDAYVTVSFFVSNDGNPPQASPRDLRGKLTVSLATDDEKHRAQPCPKQEPPSVTPWIVPLLVTDAMETALSSRSTDVVRQYAFALTALLGRLGIASEMQSFSEDLLTTVGNDHNGLQTVSQLSPNTLRVRLGAMLQNAAHWATVPQTRNISLLVLVPNSHLCNPIDVVARTEFVDAVDGSILKSRSRDDVQRLLQKAFCDLGYEGTDSDQRERIFAKVQQNDFGGFECAVKALGSTWKDYLVSEEQLWIALTSLIAGSQYSTTIFNLPDKPTYRDPATACDPPLVAIDDGKNALKIRIDGGSGLGNYDWRAVLRRGGESELSFRADRVEVVDAGRALVAVFPPVGSLKDFASGKPIEKDSGNDWSVELVRYDGETATTLGGQKVRLFTKSKPDELPVALKLVGLKTVRTADFNRNLSYEFFAEPTAAASGKPFDAKFSVKMTKDCKEAAGKVESVKVGESNTSTSLNEFTITQLDKRTKVVLEVSGLVDGVEMTITAKTKDFSDSEPLKVAVGVPPRAAPSGGN